MYQSLLNEISKKNLDTYVSKRVYKEMYWPGFFPLKQTPFLSYETLIGSEGAPVAADIVAYNASAPEKTRRVIDKLTGTIPPIRMKKRMTETDLNLYNQLKAMASPDQNALLNLVFGDIDACVEGVNARLEWMTLKALSKGEIILSKDVNAGIITESKIDFQVSASHKNGAATVWSASVSTTTPITDIEAIYNKARLEGVTLSLVLMDRTAFGQLRNSTETQNFVRPYTLAGLTKVVRAPSLSVVNEALKDNGLPQIVIIDQSITVETEDHVQTTANPWNTGYISFLPQQTVGNMLYGPIAEETNPPKQVTQTKVGPILISKYSSVDPVEEFTKGELNAFPQWASVDQCWMMNVLNASTWA